MKTNIKINIVLAAAFGALGVWLMVMGFGVFIAVSRRMEWLALGYIGLSCVLFGSSYMRILMITKRKTENYKKTGRIA